MTRKRRSNKSRVLIASVVRVSLLMFTVLPGRAKGEAFDRYGIVEQFSLPAGAGPWDSLNDGRVITLVLDELYVETAAGSRLFSLHGTLPGASLPGFGAAFLLVSPDGTKIAAGNNGGASFSDYRVGVFTISGLLGDWFAVNHFDAAWYDDRYLAVTAGDFVNPSVVTLLDTQSSNPSSPSNPTVIDGIGGGSGGVAFDAAGNLFTGNGFTTSGPSGTGVVKGFTNSEWMNAWTTMTPLGFENGGSEIVDVLSAWPLAFDGEGNLLVGGGDFGESGQSDYVAVVRNSAVVAALGGGGPAESDDPQEVRRLDPDAANDSNFFAVNFGAQLSQLYVNDSSNDTLYVYVDLTGIPAVSTWGATSLFLLTASAGCVLIRRNMGRRPAKGVVG